MGVCSAQREIFFDVCIRYPDVRKSLSSTLKNLQNFLGKILLNSPKPLKFPQKYFLTTPSNFLKNIQNFSKSDFKMLYVFVKTYTKFWKKNTALFPIPGWEGRILLPCSDLAETDIRNLYHDEPWLCRPYRPIAAWFHILVISAYNSTGNVRQIRCFSGHIHRNKSWALSLFF